MNTMHCQKIKMSRQHMQLSSSYRYHSPVQILYVPELVQRKTFTITALNQLL